MKLLVLLTFCLGLAFGSDVIDLTDANFESEVNRHDFILVEFFAPWCGHCKKLAPEYEKAATRLKREDPPIPLAKMDCTANQDSCSKHGVSGYPTLKMFRSGVPSDYNGPRQEDGIVKFILKQAAPAYKELSTPEALEKFLTYQDGVVVGYFLPKHSWVKTFQKTADALRDDYRFGIVTNEDMLTTYKNQVVFHRAQRLQSKFEPNEVVMPEQAPNKANMGEFVREHFFGKCAHATADNFGKMQKPLALVMYEVDYAKNLKGTNYWRNRVVKWSKEYHDSMNFAIANKDEMSAVLQLTDLPKNADGVKQPKPVCVIIDGSDRKYIMQDLVSKDTFPAFLAAFKEGSVEPHIKSEEVPASNDAGAKVVVGKTFDEIVMDDSKDVLIEFYAPWCGHCKSLAPKWDELGEKMADDNDVVIAKIDATANDSPSQFAVSGFPTIFWAPKGNKQNPKKYQGARDVKDFMKFIKENRSSAKTEL